MASADGGGAIVSAVGAVSRSLFRSKISELTEAGPALKAEHLLARLEREALQDIVVSRCCGKPAEEGDNRKVAPPLYLKLRNPLL